MRTGTLIAEMMEYDRGDPKRISHFLKVHAYAKSIGELEGLPEEVQQTLEIAAIVHDIGIRVSEKKYGSAAGHYQELEGPPVARALLEPLGVSEKVVDRVCFLVGHHHTLKGVDGLDWQILLEADFLVNLDEGNVSLDGIEKVRREVFQTGTGLRFLDCLFGTSD